MRRACSYHSEVSSGGMSNVRVVCRSIGVGLGVWLLVLTMPAAAYADGIFIPFIGMSAKNDQTEKVTTYGVSLAGMAAGIFGFELDFGQTSVAKTDSVFVQDSTVTTLNGNVIIGLPLGRLRPYAVGGLGWLRNEITSEIDVENFKDEGLGIDMGGGIMGFFGDHVGARIDLRYFRGVSAGEAVLDFKFKSFSFWRFSSGLVLRF